MGNGLLSLATGFAGGYMQGQQHKRQQERQDKQDAWQEEQHAALRQEQQQKISLQNGLRDAAVPAQVSDNGATMTLADGKKISYGDADVAGSDFRMIRRADEATGNQSLATAPTQNPPVDAAAPEAQPAAMSLSPMAPQRTATMNGKAYSSLEDAQAAGKAYDAPETVAARQAGAYRAAGAPEKAMTLENGAVARKRSDEAYEQGKADHARKLQEEGVFTALRAFRAGDASGLAKAFNGSGEVKIDGVPEITKEDRDVPGIGKIPSYTAKMRIVQPDGSVQEKVYNSHDLSMQLMPYEKSLELQRKGTDSDNKANYQTGLLETKIKQLELTGQLAEARALKAAANGGTVGREERLRFSTLFSDAGRRMSEAQKALSSLQKDGAFSFAAHDPKSPEAAQLADLQASIKSYGEERSMWQGLLSGSQSAPAEPATPTAKPPMSLTPPASTKPGSRPPLSAFNR